MERILLLIFGGIAVALLVAIQVIDMAARIEWVDQHWPWLLGWAEHKAWHRVLLLVAILLLGGDLWEITKEQPLTLPNVVSADPGAKDAQIAVLKKKVAALSLPASKDKRQLAPTPFVTQPDQSGMQAKIDELTREVEVTKHSLTDQDLMNIQWVFRGFSEFRKSIGANSPCLVKVTSSADKVDQQMARTVLQIAQMASNCKVEGPQNFDFDPDLEKVAMDGSIPNKIILHALKGQQWGNDLYGTLNFALRVMRSYEIPKDAQENFVWLQFGQGAHFNN